MTMNGQIEGVRSASRFIAVCLVSVIVVMSMGSSALSAPMTASAQSQTSITLTWTAPGDDLGVGTATAYSIRYSTVAITDQNWSQATEVASPPTPKPAESDESFDVTGLEPNTLYYFAIKAVDEVDNWAELSTVVSTSTDSESDPPSAVADMSISDSTSTSLTVSFTAPGDDGGSGVASQYDLRYSEEPITSGNFSSATQFGGLSAPLTAGSTEIFTITGLSSSTTYSVAVKTADEVPNWSLISNIVSGSTSVETVAPASTADLAAGSPTETGIVLSWTAPGDDGSSGQASQYDIRYATSAINAANWGGAVQIADEPAPAQAGTGESYSVSGLSSATVYYFAIKAVDEAANWSSLSNVVSLSTGPDQTPPADVDDMDEVDTSGQ